jgi:hypothetical protein
MKRVIAAGFFLLAAAGIDGPGFPAAIPQAPLSGLPPVDYSLGPDSQPHPDVPKGTLTQHRLAPGKFFPGTPHDYRIYVPAQYDPGRLIAWSIAFGGPDRAWLFVTQGGKIFRRETRRTGVVAWEPVKPPVPGL